MDLFLVRLIRHGQSCLLEETKNGWFLPYTPIQRSGKDIKTVVKSNVSESFKKVKNVKGRVTSVKPSESTSKP